MKKSGWHRRGSAGVVVLVLFVIVGLLFVGILMLEDDEGESGGEYACDEYGNCEFYEEADSDWYDDDEDYDDDDEVWNSWETEDKKRPKKSRLHGQYGDGLFKSEAELRAYVNKTYKSIDEVWVEIFKEYKKKYRKPKMKMFLEEVDTACGTATSEDGPFYCSEDETVYLDLNFFANMSDELDVNGEFAVSYVIAHEYGHHIQNLIGDLEKYGEREQRLRDRGKVRKANLVSVQTELQADFYAGVWASRYDDKTDAITEKNIEEALTAAMAVGDDALGEDRRENFGHGSSEMRIRWLVRGMATGDVRYGNTYDFKSLKKLEEVDMMLDDDDENSK